MEKATATPQLVLATATTVCAMNLLRAGFCQTRAPWVRWAQTNLENLATAVRTTGLRGVLQHRRRTPGEVLQDLTSPEPSGRVEVGVGLRRCNLSRGVGTR